MIQTQQGRAYTKQDSTSAKQKQSGFAEIPGTWLSGVATGSCRSHCVNQKSLDRESGSCSPAESRKFAANASQASNFRNIRCFLVRSVGFSRVCGFHCCQQNWGILSILSHCSHQFVSQTTQKPQEVCKASGCTASIGLVFEACCQVSKDVHAKSCS